MRGEWKRNGQNEICLVCIFAVELGSFETLTSQASSALALFPFAVAESARPARHDPSAW